MNTTVTAGSTSLHWDGLPDAELDFPTHADETHEESSESQEIGGVTAGARVWCCLAPDSNHHVQNLKTKPRRCGWTPHDLRETTGHLNAGGCLMLSGTQRCIDITGSRSFRVTDTAPKYR